MRNDVNTVGQLQLAKEWLDVSVERFQQNLLALNIHSTGALAASFKKEVIGAAGGDTIRLRLAYALYGKFVDMGVGRGMGAGVRKGNDGYERIRRSRGRLRRHTRRAKKWYSKEMAFQTHRLAELMLDLHGRVALSVLTEVPKTVEVNL